MQKNTSVALGDHFTGFIEQQVAAGRYGSATDVVRSGLRLLEQHELQLQQLRADLMTGEQSGVATDFAMAQFIKERFPA